MATVQLLGCVNGLLYPKFAGGCLALYALGRVIYGYGYTSGGPTGRMAGGLISHLADLPLWICTAHACASAGSTPVFGSRVLTTYVIF